MLLELAGKSLWNRRGTVMLCVLSIGISLFVLLGIEHLRHQTKANFTRSVSGADLIVGARGGELNLLLYSIFRIGDASNNISWSSYQTLASDPAVAWSIPLTLGDSHRGYRVLGTDASYFKHYRYGQQQALELAAGNIFEQPLEVVLGHEVARKLDYHRGSRIIIAHGTGSTSFSNHDQHPFTVTGILTPTGTPVDQTLHVSLESLERIHQGWPGSATSSRLQPESITAFIVGLESRMQTFRFQRQVNTYPEEALMAVLPGVALTQLWRVVGVVEQSLLMISSLVLLAAMLGMTTMMLASMRERRSEIAVLRAMGASPAFIFFGVQIEAVIITALGVLLGSGLLLAAVAVGGDILLQQFGLYVGTVELTGRGSLIVVAAFLVAVVCALAPGIGAYRISLQSRLTGNA